MTDPMDTRRDAASPPSLNSAERRALKARAHDLDPVVMVGDAGITDAVVAETDRALAHHGLIKVRIFGDDRDSRQQRATELEQRTGSALVQAIGKLVVLWRPRPQDGNPLDPAPQPARRKVISVPKKLAAEGKSTRTRKVRPGAPRERTALGAAGPRNATPGSTTPRSGPLRNAAPGGAMPRARILPARPVGPGLRDARGALDRSVARPARAETPARPSSTRPASSRPAGKDRSSEVAGRTSTGPARTSRGSGVTRSARPGPRTRGPRREP